MNKRLAIVIAASIAMGVADFAAMAAPPATEQSAGTGDHADWSEGGRWLVPWEMPGYSGYSERWPAARQAEQPPREPAPSGSDRPPI
jgi:hypothetical protein